MFSGKHISDRECFSRVILNRDFVIEGGDLELQRRFNYRFIFKQRTSKPTPIPSAVSPVKVMAIDAAGGSGRRSKKGNPNPYYAGISFSYKDSSGWPGFWTPFARKRVHSDDNHLDWAFRSGIR